MTDELKAALQKIADTQLVSVEVPFDTDPVTPPGKQFIVSKSELETSAVTEPLTLISASGGVNIRDNNSITGKKIGEFAGDVEIKATSEHTNGFYKIEAWVSDLYAKPKPPDTDVQMYVIGNYINVRKEPNSTATLLGQLNFRVGLVVRGKIVADGHNWGQIISDEVNIGIGGYVAIDLLGTVRPPIIDTSPGIMSRVGLHLLPEVGVEVLQFLRDLYLAGRPIRGVTLLKPSNISVAQIKQASPSTEVLVRRYIGSDAEVNPDHWPSLTRQDGRNYYNNKVRPTIDADDRLANLLQPILNEPGYDITGTINFWNGMLDVADMPLGVFLFGVGIPPLATDPPPQNAFWTQQSTIDLTYRIANETVGGKHHKIAIHQYTNPTLVRPRYWNDQWTILRHQQVMRYHPVYKQVRWVFAEFGDEKMLEQGSQFFIQNVAMADAAMQNDPVDWFAIWTVMNVNFDPNRNWGHDNVAAFLPNLKTYILGLG